MRGEKFELHGVRKKERAEKKRQAGQETVARALHTQRGRRGGGKRTPHLSTIDHLGLSNTTWKTTA